MNKPSEIRIEIADPCNEDWNKMTPCEQGRYCAQCQKQVIDFTTWSDAALFNFFATRPQNVCGRMLVSQTQRAIHIPPQPHSRLYRMVVAMGLAALAAQPVNAQSKPPLKNDTVLTATTLQEKEKPLTTGELRGKVLDDKKEPLLAATIQVFQRGKLMGRTVTDFDGEYIVAPLEPGYYDVLCTFTGYDSLMLTMVIVSPGKTITQNFPLERQTGKVSYPFYSGLMGAVLISSATPDFNEPERISDKKLQKERERKERKAAKKDKRNNNK